MRSNPCMKSIVKVLAGFGLLTMLSGCGGTMDGAVRGTGQPVQLSYEQEMGGNILTTVIDGESFRGKAVMRGRGTVSGTGFGTAQAGGVPVFGTTSIFGSVTTGDHTAVLLGSRGSTLTCEMNYSSGSGYIPSGGVGTCLHSDSRRIDLVW